MRDYHRIDPQPAQKHCGAKLDYRTFPDEPPQAPRQTLVSVNFYDFGDGLAEGVAFVRPTGARTPRQTDPIPDEVRREENEKRATRRAKTQVRRLTLAGGLTHLLTLTTRRLIRNPEIMWALWERYTRLVREALPQWPFVAVQELQKRGALHVHAAVAGYQDVRLLRRLWLKVLDEYGMGDGAVNVRPPRGRSRVKVAQYLTKYISKAMDDGLRDFGGHRYRVSQGIKCEPIRHTQSSWRGLRPVLEKVFTRAGCGVYSAVLIEGVEAMWACSWDVKGRPVRPKPSIHQRRASHDVYTRP